MTKKSPSAPGRLEDSGTRRRGCGARCDDQALLGLAEDLGQPHRRHHAASDHVAQHRAGADRRQLIDVAHQHQPRASAARRSARGQPHVDHRASSTISTSASSGRSRVALEGALLRVALEQAVQRRRLGARSPRSAAWRRARWARRADALTRLLRQDRHDAAHDRRLADAGAAGDHQHLAVARRVTASACWRASAMPRLLLVPCERARLIDLQLRRRAAEQLAQPDDEGGNGHVFVPRPRLAQKAARAARPARRERGRGD